MAGEQEYGGKLRVLMVMKALQEWPFHYTRQMLADKYGVHADTIKEDFNVIKNAGLELVFDESYRYGFAADKPYEQLKGLYSRPPRQKKESKSRPLSAQQPRGAMLACGSPVRNSEVRQTAWRHPE